MLDKVTFMKKLICKLIGHKFEMQYIECYHYESDTVCIYKCPRCGKRFEFTVFNFLT